MRHAEVKVTRSLITDTHITEILLFQDLMHKLIKGLSDDECKVFMEKMQFEKIDETEDQYREVINNDNLTFAERIREIQINGLDLITYRIKINLDGKEEN